MAKPIDALQPSDFADHPIWEYSMDEDEGDETWVCPCDAETVPAVEGDSQVYHVAADITAANGQSFVGFMSICEGVIEDPDPIVVGNGNNYWTFGSRPLGLKRQDFERFFGCAYDDLFPLGWTLRVTIGQENERRSGTFMPERASF
ncbi:MAG: hypothetical protein SF172_10225 [Burkholderiales bacterium]|nr:hypothetical protein [Burkholderiales bacterium]